MSGWRLARPRSIRARMTVRALGVVAPVILICITVVSVVLRHEIEREQVDRAAQAARQVALHLAESGYSEPIPAADGVLRIQVVDGSGEVVAASDAMQGRPPLSDRLPAENDFRVDDKVCPDDLSGRCLVVAGFETDSRAYGPVVVYAAIVSAEVTDGFLLEFGLVAVALVVLLVVGWLTWWGTGRTLRPVESIRSDLERLSATDLRHRLALPGTGDELADLARTANATLDRLQTAMERQRSFVSDASHELRNPIAGMRARLEVELTDPELGDTAARRSLESVLGDVERLQRIVSDLLELARLDADVARAEERVDLAELARAEAGHRAAAAARIDTDLEPGAVVRGNRLRLARLLVNLIANAERHARSRILVAVRAEDGGAGPEAVLEVHDDGAGIPEEERERIFERFARLDESRRKDPGGSGLGLAISRGVAEAHGGTLTAGESPLLGGAVFVLRVPAGPSRGGPEPEQGRTEGKERR
ncbi:HAMP domain-containing histidine kinase [Nocardiopsis sp. CNT-189]|uniref:HAMP domain-containing sensor histidine kinase n=1 Tax=Nocardiopsis oceanisediminis TaxID=2816862 RepID=UPI003B322CCE